ncbi:MAG: ATP-dependent sacrificial sulfur transferase LarE [Candidatus Heimdallarchaeaceae archaeon]
MKDILLQFEEFFKGKNVLVAFSGGVDSSVLLELAIKFAKHTHAVFIKTAFISTEEHEFAEKYLHEKNVPYSILSSDVFANPKLIENNEKRCYYCKKSIFSKIKSELADNFDIIVEGSNASDLSDYRPGLQALKELKITSPYIEFGISKKTIRLLAKELQLSMADKPSNACLATRIPYNSPITKSKLERIEKAENFIRKHYDVIQLRVRDHDVLARIEVLPEDIEKIVDINNRMAIAEYLTKLGYRYVTVDLKGYRTGSLNPLPKEKQKENI